MPKVLFAVFRRQVSDMILVDISTFMPKKTFCPLLIYIFFSRAVSILLFPKTRQLAKDDHHRQHYLAVHRVELFGIALSYLADSIGEGILKATGSAAWWYTRPVPPVR